MRLLLTNHALHHPGGTETWTQTIATELVDRGHDVEIATFISGMVADRMPCRVRLIGDLGEDTWDMMLINHNTCLAMVQGRPGFKIFTSHGPAHNLEKPAPGADCYVAVSEEVRGTHGSAAFVIRQPIDIRKFRPRPAVPPETDVLVMTKNAETAKTATEACDKAGLTTSLAHYIMRPCLDVDNLIPSHKAVITSGRGILEALACGVPAFCLNHARGEFFGDGWVTQEKLLDMQRVNYSGRSGKAFGGADEEKVVETLAVEIMTPPGPDFMNPPRYPYGDGYLPWAQDWILQNHDSRKICDHYLNLKTDADTIYQTPKEAITI